MFFNVCEHYDDNKEIIRDECNNCFICFEYKINNENIPTSLHKQKIYLNNCICNGSIHNYCLKIWFDKNKSCPICRINVIESNNITIIFYKFIPYGITIYMLIKNISIIFIFVISILLFLYIFVNLCTILLITIYTFIIILYEKNN